MKQLVCLALIGACTNSQSVRPETGADPAPHQPADAPAASPPTVAAVATSHGDGTRPRFDVDGDKLVWMQGAEGARDIVVSDTAGSRRFETKGDDVDPTWLPDGRILFASNRDGDFDLWLLDPADGTVEQVTNFEGDELEPTVAPVGFGFYAVANGICGSPASGAVLDTYYKALFTRRTAANAREIWWASIAPRTRLELPIRASDHLELSEHGTHTGRVSPPKSNCEDPSFAWDGLSAVYVCDGSILDAPARWEASFGDALRSLKDRDRSKACSPYDDLKPCLAGLEKRYATYPGTEVAPASAGLQNPSVSANQIVLIANTAGRPMQRARYQADAAWQPFPQLDVNAQNLVWSPTGREIAFDNGEKVLRADTSHYLQTVRNLNQFEELHTSRESPLLQKNRFVVRPADHKEFYVLHDKLRYAERPQFITTDVAMQLFRDEFLRIIERAEDEAQKTVHQLSFALMHYFAARYQRTNAQIDRYYAVLFATGWVPLHAALTMQRPTSDDYLTTRFDPDHVDDETKQRMQTLGRPVAERLPAEVPRVLRELPDSIRRDVSLNIDRMMQHAGIAQVQIPGEPKPRKIDFSQFKIRGAYAENNLGGYFVAMSWFATMPLPIDASLTQVIEGFRTRKIGKEQETALAAWERVNAMVGSFMGRPVDATLRHVIDEVGSQKSFDVTQLKKRLLKLRGPVPIRDADNEDRALAVTLFPKRVGLDVTFFRQLTHPAVDGRAWPSSLDVFAALGNEQATKHASATMAAAYQKALKKLAKSTPDPQADPAYWSTDIYHSWMAALFAAAAPYEVPADVALEFASTEAWRDRQLHSALAGYAQLKHSAVLYAMQDMGVECGDDEAYYLAVEQPLTPRPRGFVEPNVAFYDAIAALAARTYRDVYQDPEGPNADQWASDDDPRANVMAFARDLAAIARSEVAGKPLSREQHSWIEFVGGRIEQLTIAMHPDQMNFSIGSNEREKRGVSFVTDIHTNTQRQQALHVGVGRIFDLWVVVPNRGAGERLTQGGVLSFYEFPHAMSDRLTDQQWAERVDAGKLPAELSWTQSFIESR